MLVYAVSALAISVGVSPGKLAYSVRAGGTEIHTLSVVNQDSEASDFEVYVEGKNSEWFTVVPDKFTLGGQEQKSVEIALAPPLTTAPQEFDTTVCVVSLIPGADLRIGAGIKVSTHVQVNALPVMSFQWWIVTAVILVVLVIGAFILWRRRLRYG